MNGRVLFLLLLILKYFAIIAIAVMHSDSMNHSHKLWQLIIFFETLTSCRGGSTCFLCESEQHALRVHYEEEYIIYPPNKYWYIVKWAKRFSTDKCFWSSILTFNFFVRIKNSFLHLSSVGRIWQNVKCWIHQVSIFPAQPSNMSHRKENKLFRFSVHF